MLVNAMAASHSINEHPVNSDDVLGKKHGIDSGEPKTMKVLRRGWRL